MKNLISCFTNSYLKFGVDAAIEHLPTVGLKLVEFPVRTHGQPTFFGDTPWLTNTSSAADVAKCREKLTAADLQPLTANISSGNPLEDTALAITLDKLRIATDLGAKFVVAGGGAAESAAERTQLLQHLTKIGDAAEALGITYCCETHPGVCVNAESMAATMRELNHPHVRLNFDTGNILFYNAGADVYASLQMVREWVAHVHLKDHNGQPNDWHFPALGAGIIDFTRIRQLLDDTGFHGPYSLEIEGIEGEEADLQRCQNRIAQSVGHLENWGY